MAMVHQLTSSGMPLSSEYRKLFCCIYLDVNTSLSTVTVVAGWKTNNCRSFLMNVLLHNRIFFAFSNNSYVLNVHFTLILLPCYFVSLFEHDKM